MQPTYVDLPSFPRLFHQLDPTGEGSQVKILRKRIERVEERLRHGLPFEPSRLNRSSPRTAVGVEDLAGHHHRNSERNQFRNFVLGNPFLIDAVNP
jgi:hypothetical protein